MDKARAKKDKEIINILSLYDVKFTDLKVQKDGLSVKMEALDSIPLRMLLATGMTRIESILGGFRLIYWT